MDRRLSEEDLEKIESIAPTPEEVQAVKQQFHEADPKTLTGVDVLAACSLLHGKVWAGRN